MALPEERLRSADQPLAPPRSIRPPHLPYPASDLLRFSTAGSVDDGKSTLIGRLLHDSKGIFEDQLAALEAATRRRGGDGVDLALLTDGLRAEREQGITIDVAYRYFATPRRKFIVADTPGHLQYTRNMVTGCSTADLAVVLVDARAGVLEQTRRHVVIAALLRVPRVIVAINKMDLVGYDGAVFGSIAAEVRAFAARLGIVDVTAIPVSALCGDNVVERSDAMPWYEGPPLLEHLETVDPEPDDGRGHLRLPIQWVIRGRAGGDYRAFAGRIERGAVRPGDTVVALPSGVTTSVEAIDTFDGPLAEAFAPLSVAVRLADDVDLGRGGLIAGPEDPPVPRRELDALVCWLGGAPLNAGRRYRLTNTTRTVRAVATEVAARLDINTLRSDAAATELATNDVGRVRLLLAEPVYADAYRDSRATGSAILVDETTNETVGAVLILADGEDWPEGS
jgi:sulfate adenylyltransferase subunit 1